MKIVATSDWHNDARTSGFPRWDDVCEAVNRSLAVVLAEDADVYLMLGDLTDPDTRLAWRSSAFAMNVARRLRDMDVDSLWIAGNHDVVEDGFGTTTLSPLSFIADVAERPGKYALGFSTTIEVFALPFCAPEVAYDPEQVVRDAARDGVNPRLVVGHLNIKGAHPGSESKDMPRGREIMWPTDAIRECWPRALMLGGHYHRGSQVVDGVHILGSLVRLSHGEEDNQPCITILEM